MAFIFFSLFLSTFGCVMFYLTRKKKAKEARTQVFKGKYYDKIMALSFVARLNNYLKNSGYPLGMTAETLVMIHIAAFVVIIIQLLGGNYRIIQLPGIMLLIIDALIITYAEKYKKEIVVQLCDIQDIVYFQSKIKTPQDVILAYCERHCKYPLKPLLSRLLSRYKYMGIKDTFEIFEELRRASNVMELQSFSFILEQKERTGFSEDNHKAQAVMLKRAKRLKRKMARSVKRLKLIIASILLFACYTGFITLPIMKELMNKLSIIWRS